MTHPERLDYVLNLFKANKMDIQLSTIRGLIPEELKPFINEILDELVKTGYLEYKNHWWSGTKKGRDFSGFVRSNILQIKN
jgi:hypothetical protein